MLYVCYHTQLVDINNSSTLDMILCDVDSLYQKIINSLKADGKFIHALLKVKKISNDQELIQSDPISCPQNQKGNN